MTHPDERDSYLDELHHLKHRCGGEPTVGVSSITYIDDRDGSDRVFVSYDIPAGGTKYDDHTPPETWSLEHPVVVLYEYLALDEDTTLTDVDPSVPARFSGQGLILGLDYKRMRAKLKVHSDTEGAGELRDELRDELLDRGFDI